MTDRCNLRCFYCSSREGENGGRGRRFAPQHIVAGVRLLVRLGISKVRLTGGEALVDDGLVELAASLRAIDGLRTLGLTTNGTLLRDHAGALRQAGVAHLNISLDTLRPERYAQMTGVDAYPAVRAGIDAALDAAFESVKVNVVLVPGVNDDEAEDFALLARDRPLSVRFIELMPLGPQAGSAHTYVATRDLITRLSRGMTLAPHSPSGGANGPAREYTAEGFRGTLGFISPMSEPFCGACNRLRIAADGTLRACLFVSSGFALLPAVEAGVHDDVLAERVIAAVAQKPSTRPDDNGRLRLPNGEGMADIGG